MMKAIVLGALISAICGGGGVNASQPDSKQPANSAVKDNSNDDTENFESWTHEPKGPAGKRMRVHCIAISSDGRTIVAACMGPVVRSWFSVSRVIDAKTGKGLRELYGHKFGVSVVAISPDGTFALSGCRDKTMRSWDIEKGWELRKFVHRAPVLSVAISPDGKQALSCYDTIRLWDLKTGKLIHAFEGHTKPIWSVAFSPDGKRILSGSGDETVRLWDIETREELKRFEGHIGRVKRVRFSPDGKTAVSCSTSDSKVCLWNLNTGALIREFEAHAKGVASVEFSPDGRRILSVGGGQQAFGRWIDRPAKIRLWDVATGKQVLELGGHGSYVPSAIFSPKGQWVFSGGGDGVIRSWNLKELLKKAAAEKK